MWDQTLLGCWTKSNFLNHFWSLISVNISVGENEVFISNVHLFSLWSDKWKVEMTKNALFSILFECRTVLSFYICQIKFLNILCQQSHSFVRKSWDRLNRTNLKWLFSTSNHHFTALLLSNFFQYLRYRTILIWQPTWYHQYLKS